MFVCSAVSLCSGACAEVDSDTEAVAGEEFKLGCISCKMRGEVEASAVVDWMFRARGEDEFKPVSSDAAALNHDAQHPQNEAPETETDFKQVPLFRFSYFTLMAKCRSFSMQLTYR